MRVGPGVTANWVEPQRGQLPSRRHTSDTSTPGCIHVSTIRSFSLQFTTDEVNHLPPVMTEHDEFVQDAEGRCGIRCTRGFDGFVTSSAAPTATGWSDPSPGGNLTRCKSPPFHGAQYFDHTPASG